MDHREFMDDIIKGMTSSEKETTKDVPIDENEDTSNNLKFVLSTGECFELDPDNFDWDTAIEKIPLFIQNQEIIRQMVNTILVSDDSNNEQICVSYIEQLETYLKSYQIIPHYVMLDPDINNKPMKHLMVLLYDTQSVMETMYSSITMFSAMRMLTAMKPTSDEIEGITETKKEPSFDGSDKKSFKVEARILGDKGLTIVSITPDDDCPPDEYYMPDKTGNETFNVHVFAKSTLDAKRVAIDSFREAGFPIFNDLIEFDNKKESGLLDE